MLALMVVWEKVPAHRCQLREMSVALIHCWEPPS